MLRVLICSAVELGPQLRETFIGRQGIETYRAEPRAGRVGGMLRTGQYRGQSSGP